MIFEIKKLMAKGAYTGDFSFVYQPQQEDVLVPLCNIEDGVKVFGSYEIFDGDEVEINLNLAYVLKGQCSYCLKDASQNVEYSAQILFVTEKNGDDYYYDGNRLDLSQAVNDALLFSQPKVLLCKEDCKGIKID